MCKKVEVKHNFYKLYKKNFPSSRSKLAELQAIYRTSAKELWFLGEIIIDLGYFCFQITLLLL